MTDSLKFSFEATDNVSQVIKKIADASRSLDGDTKNLVKSLGELSKAAANSSSKQLAELRRVADASKKLTMQQMQDATAYSKLRMALAKGDLASLQQLKPIDLVGNGGSAKQMQDQAAGILELQRVLKGLGITMASFQKGGGATITPDIINAQAMTASLNELRSKLGKPLLITAEVRDVGTKEFYATLRGLNKEWNGLQAATKAGLIARVNLAGLESTTKSFKDLKATLAELSAGSSIAGFENAINFNSIRQSSINAIQDLDKLKASMRAIGPAAIAGNKEAAQTALILENQIASTEARVKSLNAQMNNSKAVLATMMSRQNIGLTDFKYKPITVNDIFPTAEQQKLEQLKAKINDAVRININQGAIKDTINGFSSLQNGLSKLTGGFVPAIKQIKQADDGLVRMAEHLPRIRYALYDVSNSAAIMGASLLAIPAATFAVAIGFQRDFANVVRTTGVMAEGAGAADRLQKQFVELSKTIPVSFKDLTVIGELAGQLNIGNASITRFTESVAMFAATTDVTTTEAATAFGRLDQLIDGVNGQYDKLGSAILKVGVNSVATESQIIRIAQQISSIGNLAGFSVDQVIAFSGALASVGTTPELSRGLFTRLFTEMNGAIIGSNDSLAKFASLAGQTSQEFLDNWVPGKSAWQVVAVLKGLSAEGPAAEQSLRALGIASVRDIPTVLKLAQGYGDVIRLMNLSQAAFLQGTEMQKQYSLITATVSEKIKLLMNNFQALIATAGNTANSFGPLIDAATQIIGFFQHIIDNPISGTLVTIGIAIVGVLGALALAISAFSRIGAVFSGVATASLEVHKAVAMTKIGFADVTTSMQGTEVQANKTALAVARAASAGSAAGRADVSTNGTATGASGLIMPYQKPSAVPKLDDTIPKNTSRLGALSKALMGAALASGVFKGALIALASTTVIGLALTALTLGIDAVSNSMKSAQDKAKDYFNAVDLTASIQADTAEWIKTESAISTFETTAKNTGDTLTEVEKSALKLTDANVGLTLSQEELNKSMGDNAAVGAATVNALASEFTKKIREQGSDSPFAKLFAETDSWDKFAATGINAIDLLNIALSKGGVAAAETYINNGIDPLILAQQKLSSSSLAQGDLVSSAKYSKSAASLIEVSNAYKELARQGIVLTENEKRQISIEQIVAKTTEASASAAENAASSTSKYADAVSSLFTEENASSKFSDSLQKLNDALASGGTSFDAWGASGQANIANVQASLTSALAYGEQAGVGATVAISAVLGQLVANGASTVDIMKKINELALTDPTLGIDPAFLQDVANNKYPAISQAFMDVKKAEDAVIASSKNVKKELVTIGDYASKLSSVWKSAFSIRFDGQKGLDSITSSFQNISKATKDANDSIRDLNADLSQLTADKTTTEYFLGIANSFGNVENAAILQARLDKINADIAAKSNQVTVAQQSTDKSLTGTSAAAIANRATITGLVGEYQGYIETLANSGLSAAELSTRTAQLEADFTAQATALGFSSTELGVYQAAFKDVTTAIDNVPRDVTSTVDFETDPAKRKLAEMTAAADTTVSDIANNTSTALASAHRNLIDALSTANADAKKKATEAAAMLRAQSADTSSSGGGIGADWKTWLYQQRRIIVASIPVIGPIVNGILSLFPSLGWADGGYTGAGGKYDVAGTVHKGEYVVPANQVNQSTQKPYFMEQSPKFFSGGYVGGASAAPTTMMVELSPTDRQLLAQAGNVQLSIDGRVIAGATNGANNVYAQRGTN